MQLASVAASLPGRVSRLDRAWLAIACILVLLLALSPTQAEASLIFTARALLGVAPFLVLSAGIAAYAKATGAEHLIARAFQGHVLMMVPVAAAVGALSPFCSCGVIPIIAALLAVGVPLAPVMAFWLASPLMDPSMFLMTTGTLGLGFALAKTAAALGVGLLGGFGIHLLQRRGLLTEGLREGVGNGGCGGAKIRNPKAVVWRFWDEPARRTAFGTGAVDTLLFLGKWLILAFLLESLMLAYIPAETVARFAGGDGLLQVVGAAFVGIPAYLNGYAALPLVSGLMTQGMGGGVAMTFLIAGGVTSIPAAIAVWAVARPPVFAAYIGFAVAGAIASGLLYGLA
ncbi:uncharacterized membrane protein YraQ (UPF0718 family) [Constrictibacter sp. MBR-5]|jgi:uncharacterized membrane protein YraQ (UPF0718 family)|uniref:permease n=1 Tax=Constrictibacter sp. MBR-5 TaxID=3156467 RepID=UPI0033944655